MKTREKVMLYALLPFAYLMHGLKNAGKFVGKKSKPAVALFVAVMMLLSVMPMSAFAAEYDGWSDGETLSTGTYNLNGATVTITETLNINGAVTIENGTIKRGFGFDGEMFAVGNGDSLTLQDITVDGNKENQSGNSIIVIDNGTVTLGNGALLTNNKIASIRGIGSAVTVTEGTLNINGGKITNNVAYSDGGSTIKTYYGSTVNMTDGEISGNSGARHGGAIQVYGATELSTSTEKQTVFNMSGGTITGNSCSGVGGGVAVSRKALFNMTGGTITGNSCGTSGKGGGVAFSESASNNIEMLVSGDAVISGNKKGSANNNLEIGADNKLTVGAMGSNANVGVTMASAGVFSIGGASYIDKFKSDSVAYEAAAEGNNLKLTLVHRHCVCGGNVTMGGHTHDADAPVYTAWNKTDSLPTSGNYYLTTNVTVSTYTTIGSGNTLNLCLNGCTITGESYYVFSVLGKGKLNICDCSENNSGALSNANAIGAGIYNNGTINIYGGHISDSEGYGMHNGADNATINVYGGTVDGNYSGIYGYGTINVYGGTVSGKHGIQGSGKNSITVSDGKVTGTEDGIYASDSRSDINITISGGTVTGVESGVRYNCTGALTVSGGTVSATAGDGIYNCDQGTVTVTGGTVKGTGDYCGIFVGNGALLGSVTVTGGTVKGGKYGISSADDEKGIFLSNAPTITGTQADIYLGGFSFDPVTFSVVGTLTGSYSVETENAPTEGNPVTITSGWSGAMGENAEKYDDYFTSANSDYKLKLNDSGELELVLHTHNYTYAVNTENAAQIIESCTCGHSETATLEHDTTVSTVYTGSAIKAIKVTYSDGWTADKNSVIQYENNINVGSAKATLTIDGKTIEKSFNIVKADAPVITFPKAVNSITYGQQLQDAGLTFTSNDYGTFKWVAAISTPYAGVSSYAVDFVPSSNALNNYDWASLDGQNGLQWIESRQALCSFVDVIVNKAEVTYTAPLAKDLTYNSNQQKLVTEGSVAGGVMWYAFGTDAVTIPTDGWAVNAPQDVNAGTYYVWYKVIGDSNHNDVDPACIEVTVKKATYDMSSAKWNYTNAFKYNGKEHKVEVVGLPSGVTASGYSGNTATVVGDYTAKVTLTYDANNYNAPSIADLNWKVENNWTPTEYAVNGSGWMNNDFAITANDGYMISLTNTDDGEWKDKLVYSAETDNGSVTFYLRNTADDTISLEKTVSYKLDKTAPTGRVDFVDRSGWEEFVNAITFGLFYKDEVTVKITSADNLSGVAKVEYYASNEGLTLDEVKNIDNWTAYSDSFGVLVEDTKKFVYYVRITDNAGNVTYLSTNGAEYDTTAPVISGIENGATYYTTQKVTVTEKNVASITLNGEAASESITLNGNAAVDTVYTIVATDKAGNSTTVTVTMKPIYEIMNGVENITYDDVKSDNAPAIREVIAKLNETLADTDMTDGERKLLSEYKETAEALIKIIEDTGAEINRINEEVNKYDGATVNSDDADALQQLAKDIKKLLDGHNLTNAEIVALNTTVRKVSDLQKIIADTTAENKRISDSVDGYDLATVTSDDKADLEQLLADTLKQLESTNLTEEEISELNGDKKAVEDLLAKIKSTGELIDKLNEDVGEYSDDTVKSTDKDDIKQIVDDIDALLETENLTEDEKKALEDAKDKAEGLLETIDDATKATDTENTEKVKDVTSENVTPEDKTDLENAKADLEKALEDYGDNYTDDEKKAIKDKISRIDAALEIISNVEAVEEAIGKLPENITRDDEDAVNEACEAYDALTDYEKSLVDPEAKKALEDAKATIEELKKPVASNSPQTGDNSNLWLWMALAFVSGGLLFGTLYIKKREEN